MALRSTVGRACIALVALGLVAACTTATASDGPVHPPIEGVSIILAGSIGPSDARVWVDGVAHEYGNAHITGVFSEQGTVYAAGRQGLLNRGVLWTDHESERLNGSGATVNDVWVQDSIPYLIGSTTFTDRATWWVGDERFLVEEDNAHAKVIGVEGDNVYFAGTIGNAVEIAGWWQNGSWTALPEAEAKVKDLFVEDGVVYIVGNYGLAGRAGLWIDGRVESVEGPAAIVTLVFVEDGVVYLAGSAGAQSVASYWVDGQRFELADDSVILRDLFVVDGVVYLLGIHGLTGNPALWVDGERVDIDAPTASVHTMFVSPN